MKQQHAEDAACEDNKKLMNFINGFIQFKQDGMDIEGLEMFYDQEAMERIGSHVKFNGEEGYEKVIKMLDAYNNLFANMYDLLKHINQ